MRKSWTGYIVRLAIMVLVLFGVSIGAKFSVKNLFDFYTRDYNPYLALQFILYWIIGIVFGSEKLLNERKIKGHWKVNIPRLTILGIPSFLLGCLLIFYYNFLSLSDILYLKFVNIVLFTNLMNMLFGYILITSFYKSE